MSFFHYGDDDDEYFCEPERHNHSEPKHWKEFAYNECNPAEQEMRLFNVDLNSQQLLLASALLSMAGVLSDAHGVLNAAWALRECLGTKAPEPTEESRDWNASYPTGQVVQVWPNGRNGESYLSKTSSPAIDTAGGPVVMLEDFDKAVSLLNITPRKLSCPEVLS